MSREERLKLIDPEEQLCICKQCEVLDIQRSAYYYQPVQESDENLEIMRNLDEQYLFTPFYGVLKLTEHLREQGYNINPKRVRRLMKLINWKTIYREPRTTIIEKAAYKYPYLLRNLKIEGNNHVWAMDITYIPMRKGFMYLCAIIDLHSRFVVNWSISNTMTKEWCVEAVNEAINKYGAPKIFNTDQGTQFTSELFTENLKNHGIAISMDGKGRAIDNVFIERLWRSVKYENVYLNVYENGLSLYRGLKDYFEFYNNKRFHENLDYKKPAQIYINQRVA